jgi:hypothetical protein
MVQLKKFCNLSHYALKISVNVIELIQSILVYVWRDVD